MSFIILALTFLFAVLTAGIKLPSYITPCRRSDPDFANCVIKTADEVLPFMLKGDPDFNIPVLTPFKIKDVKLNSGPNLQVNLYNTVINGIESTKLIDFEMDLVNNYVRTNLHIDNLSLTGTYEIDGRIQVLPIKGNGPYSLNLIGANLEIGYKCELNKKDGMDFAHVNEINMKVTTEKTTVQFDNLFNGDKKLGDEMNKFLNENWEEVKKDIIPSLVVIVKSVLQGLLNGFLDKVPFDEILLP